VNIKEVSSNSLSFLGDAVYTIHVREYFIEHKFQSSRILQKKCNEYNSAKGQMKAYQKLLDEGFFTIEELEIFKRGRNHITHIPKNGDLLSYETASGLEAISGFLYLTNPERLEKMFEIIFDGELNA